MVTATHLARRLRGSSKAEVLLIDRNRAHVWKPMLHTFAAGTSVYANENVSFIPYAKLTGYKYWPGDFGSLDRKTQTIKLKPTPLPAAGEMGRRHQSAHAAAHYDDTMQLVSLFGGGHRGHFNDMDEASARRQARCELTVLPPEEIGLAVLRKS